MAAAPSSIASESQQREEEEAEASLGALPCYLGQEDFLGDFLSHLRGTVSSAHS
jgi:hypothetical protein